MIYIILHPVVIPIEEYNTLPFGTIPKVDNSVCSIYTIVKYNATFKKCFNKLFICFTRLKLYI